jgi:hypothetical protein
MPGHNALALETNDPREFVDLFGLLRLNPTVERALRRAGRATAQHYTWSKIMHRILLPQLCLIVGSSNEAETVRHGRRKAGYKGLHIDPQPPKSTVPAEVNRPTPKGLRPRDRAGVNG